MHRSSSGTRATDATTRAATPTSCISKDTRVAHSRKLQWSHRTDGSCESSRESLSDTPPPAKRAKVQTVPQMDEQMNQRMNQQMDEQMNQQIDEQMDEYTDPSLRTMVPVVSEAHISEHKPAIRMRLSASQSRSTTQNETFKHRTQRERKRSVSPHTDLTASESQHIATATAAARNLPRSYVRHQTQQAHQYGENYYDEGMFFYSDVFPVDHNFALEHPIASVILQYNVGQAHIAAGQFREGLRLFQSALSRLQASQKDAPVLVMRIHHSSGYCHYRLSQHESSRTFYQSSLCVSLRANLGELAVAVAENALAVLSFHGDCAKTKRKMSGVLERVYVVYAKALGADTPEVATILNNLGRVWFLNGEYERALSCYEQALFIRVQTLGEKSMDVAATMCNIGHTHQQLLALDQAMLYYTRFLKLAKSCIGEKDRDIAVVLKCLGEIHHERKEVAEARHMYTQSLSMLRQVLGSCHPDLASILNKLGSFHFEQEEFDVALKYYQEGLKIELTNLDTSQPCTSVMITLGNIAQIYRLQESFSFALETYKLLLALKFQTHERDSLEVANVLSLVGLMQYQMKKYDSSFESYQEVLRIQIAHFGQDDSTEVATTLNSIGLVLFNQSVFSLAKACFLDSLRIRLKLLGPNHRDVAIIWYNIATIFLERGDREFAVQLYEETLRVERIALGHNHYDVILTLQHLGLVYQRIGDIDKALDHLTEALEIEKTKKNGKPTTVATLYNLIGNIHLLQANVDEMMNCYIKSSRIFREVSNTNDGDGFEITAANLNFYSLSRLHPPCAHAA